MKDITQKLYDSLAGLVDSVIAAAPNILMGLVLIVVALIVAKIIEKVLRMILVRVKFDELVQRTGIDTTLQRMGIRQQLNRVLPRLIYFLLLLLFAKTAADALGLVAISDAMGAFFAYVPNVIAALLLLVLGTAAGSVAGSAVTRVGKASGLDFATGLGRVVSGLIFFMIGMMALG